MDDRGSAERATMERFDLPDGIVDQRGDLTGVRFATRAVSNLAVGVQRLE
jgi:hypothetical protein